ncbi:MAG: hypothetical protein GY847_34495 [Proteobacteria bacterium]|nr:hypothetical protein [Pseudomonadota bacterium]
MDKGFVFLGVSVFLDFAFTPVFLAVDFFDVVFAPAPVFLAADLAVGFFDVFFAFNFFFAVLTGIFFVFFCIFFVTILY